MNGEAKAKSKTVRWQDEVYDLLRRNDVTQFAYGIAFSSTAPWQTRGCIR